MSRKTFTGVINNQFTELHKKRIIDILNRLWGTQISKVTESRVMEALRTRSLPVEFMSSLQLDMQEFITDKFNPTMVDLMRLSAEGSRTYPGLLAQINKELNEKYIFNATSYTVEKFIREHGAELVVEMTSHQILSLKNVLQEAVRNNWTVLKTSDFMRGAMPLTGRESQWVINFYNKKYAELLKQFIDAGYKDFEKRAYDTAIRERNRRYEFFKNSRANRIARTELVRANGQGQLESIELVKRNQKVKGVTKRWIRTNWVKDNWASTIANQDVELPDNAEFQRTAPTTAITFQYPSEINEGCYLEWNLEMKDE